jgi:hypothetical protein
MSFGGSAEKTSTKEAEEIDTTFSGTKTTQLELEQTAVDKIIQDVLGSADGLANIFQGEQTAGIFDSSVAAQASGDLTANLVGELAKITGKTTEISESDEEKRRKAKSSSKSASLSFSGVA